MKKIGYSLLITLLFFMTISCHSKNSKKEDDNNQTNINNNKSTNSIEVIKSVKAIINGIEYTIDLEDNETTRSFINYLPQELKMSELNGNEKYVYLDTSFPTNSSNPKIINAGDVMLYGDNCLVIFYKSFNTSYSYTKIGHINNLSNLGNNNITVRFENEK